MQIYPHTLIGKQVQASDGGDYGHLIEGSQRVRHLVSCQL